MAKYLYKHRRGTTSDWVTMGRDIIPLEGEIVVELDETTFLHKLKIGDGVHTYDQLAYLQPADEIVTQMDELVAAIATLKLEVSSQDAVVLVEAQTYADNLYDTIETRLEALEELDYEAYIKADEILQSELTTAIDAVKIETSSQDAIVLVEAQQYASQADIDAMEATKIEVLAQALPRTTTVTLTTDWTQETTKKYSQVITINNITTHSRIDLQPTTDMIADFTQLGFGLVVENRSGVVTVYALGNQPTQAYTIQAAIVETAYDGDDIVITGTPILTGILGLVEQAEDWVL